MLEDTEKRQKVLLAMSLVAMLVVLGAVGQSVVRQMQINTVYNEINEIVADYQTAEDLEALLSEPDRQDDLKRLNKLFNNLVSLQPPIVNIPILTPERVLGMHGGTYCSIISMNLADARYPVTSEELAWYKSWCLDWKLT